MASPQQVRIYLAHWFQLGKPLIWRNGREKILPQPVVKGDRYSQQFESCWQKIIAVGGRDCYLEGTSTTIEQLLNSEWNIDYCARCSMPITLTERGIQPLECVCSDLDNWPNSTLPQPRSPVDSTARLENLRFRLKTKETADF